MKEIKSNKDHFHERYEDDFEKIILLRSIAASIGIILLYCAYGIIIYDLKVIFLSGMACAIYGACYSFVSYTNGSITSKRVVITIIMASLIMGFFAQGGLFGITSLNLCGIILLISIVFSSIERRIFVTFYVIVVIFFVWVHLFQKDWIARYHENHSEVFLISEMLIYFIYILYIGYLYKWEIEKNRRIITETNRKLEEANTEISAQNDYILNNNEQLKALVELLQTEQNKVLKANRLLKNANCEIAKKNEYIITTNTKLESKVAERTNDIRALNKKIVRFAQYNAHRIRGPLARILGLIEIMNFDFRSNGIVDMDQSEFYLETLKQNAIELDEMVRGVTMLLSENGQDGGNYEKE